MFDRRLDYDLSNCSITQTLQLLGERWTFLILREVWFGVGRFSDLQQALGCARNLLSERLHMLVAEGILETEPLKERGARMRHRYVLTDKGKAALPILMALREWGDRYITGPEEASTNLRHKSCGHSVSLRLFCTEGHEVDDADDIEPSPGPGLRLRADRAEAG